MTLVATPQQTVLVALSTASTTEATTIASVPAGAFLYFHYRSTNPSTMLVTPQNTGTQAWTRIANQNDGVIAEETWECTVTGAGSGTTVTFLGTAAFNTLNVGGQLQEWRIPLGTPYHIAYASGTGTVMTAPSVTPVAGASCLIINTMINVAGGALSSGPTGGFTDAGVGNARTRIGYQVVNSASGSYQGAWTWTVSGAWMAAVIVFYELTQQFVTPTVNLPASSVSGAAFSPVVVMAAKSGGVTDNITTNCIATITTGNGTFVGTSTVACVAGVATFTGLGLTGNGPFTVTFAIAGYTSATSSVCTVLGALINATIAWVAANGGNSKHPAIYDPRYGMTVVSGKASVLYDAIGSYGGRTPGPDLVQATAGARPTINGTIGVDSYLSGDGVDDCMVSALDARFNLFADATTANPLFVWGVYRCSVAGPIFGIERDEASHATSPFMMVRPAGSTWCGDISTDGSAVTVPPLQAGTAVPDSGIAFADGQPHLIIIGKKAYYPDALASANIQHVYFFYHVGSGGLSARHGRFPDPSNAANKLVLFKHGASFATADFLIGGVYAGDWDKTFLRNLIALVTL